MKKRTGRLLSVLLSLAMVLTLLPTVALAEGAAGETMRFCSGILENSGATQYVVYARYNGTVYVMGQQSDDVWTAVEATDQYDQWFKFEAPTSQITTFTVETGKSMTVTGTYNYQGRSFTFTPFYLKTGEQYLTAQGGLTLGDASAKTHWITSWYDHWTVGYWTDDLIHYTTYAADNTRIVLDVSDSENPRFTCATATDATHISCRMAYQICRHENEAGEIALTPVAEVPATCGANGTEAYLFCGTCGAKYDPEDVKGYRELTDAELIILSTGTEHQDNNSDGTCDVCGKNMPSHAYAPAPTGDLTIGNKYLLVTKIDGKLYALAKPESVSEDPYAYPTPSAVEITPKTDGTIDFTDAYDAGALQITIGGGNEVWGAADVYTLEVTAKGMESGILSSTMGGNFSAEVGIDKYGWRAKVTDSNGTAIIASMYGVNWSEALGVSDPYYRAYQAEDGTVSFTITNDENNTAHPVYLYLMNTSEGEEEEHTTHTWDNGVITTQPTCTDTGVMTYTCTVCGETKSEGINALGHTYGDWVYAGESQHKHICITCGHTETAACELTMQYDTTHHWQSCSVCGGIVGKAEHNMPEIWTQNPQVANSEYRYCGTCGYNETRVKEITDATSLVQGESIVINVSDTTDATSTTLSAGTVNVLADAVSSNDVAANSVTVSLGPTTSVTYDATAVSVINNAVGNAEENTTTVTLVVENNPNLDCGMDAGMTPEQQATIINAAGAAEYDTDDSTIPDANTTPVTVYSITLEVTTGSGTTEISDFNGGSATVTVPYTEEVGENETVSVVRVETDGTTTPMNDASYDAEDRTVTWTTESHSYYMITRETASTPVPDPAPDPTPDPAPDPTPDPTPTPDPGDSGSSAPTYRTSVVAGENGTVTVSPKNAEKGDQVTITVKPDEGYELDELTVTDAKGNDLTLTDKGSGKYTFKMPASKVTVSVSFAEIEPEPVQPVELPFIDVADNAWYADAVRYVYEKGLMGGSGSAETFQPEQSITRGMLVTILYRLEGEPNTGASAFTDVIPGVWYANAVAWASASGIVNGYNGAFRPEDALTRQDMAAILYRYAGYKGYDRSVGENTNILSYTDALAVSEYAIPAMQWACGSGLIEGANGALTPTGDATRAAAATILMRFCENAAK